MFGDLIFTARGFFSRKPHAPMEAMELNENKEFVCVRGYRTCPLKTAGDHFLCNRCERRMQYRSPVPDIVTTIIPSRLKLRLGLRRIPEEQRRALARTLLQQQQGGQEHYAYNAFLYRLACMADAQAAENYIVSRRNHSSASLK